MTDEQQQEQIKKAKKQLRFDVPEDKFDKDEKSEKPQKNLDNLVDNLLHNSSVLITMPQNPETEEHNKNEKIPLTSAIRPEIKRDRVDSNICGCLCGVICCCGIIAGIGYGIYYWASSSHSTSNTFSGIQNISPYNFILSGSLSNNGATCIPETCAANLNSQAIQSVSVGSGDIALDYDIYSSGTYKGHVGVDMSASKVVITNQSGCKASLDTSSSTAKLSVDCTTENNIFMQSLLLTLVNELTKNLVNGYMENKGYSANQIYYTQRAIDALTLATGFYIGGIDTVIATSMGIAGMEAVKKIGMFAVKTAWNVFAQPIEKNQMAYVV